MGSSSDTAAYPHAGTAQDPLQDDNIQAEVTKAISANGWTAGMGSVFIVYTAAGIQECNGSNCTDAGTAPFCAYHNHFLQTDNTTETLYAFASVKWTPDLGPLVKV